MSLRKPGRRDVWIEIVAVLVGGVAMLAMAGAIYLFFKLTALVLGD